MTPIRIVALGDSTTAGTPGFLSPLESRPDGRGNPESQYTHWMMQAHPEWTVLNRGIDGERSDEVLARFERDVLKEPPAIVIVLAGVNDIYQGRRVNLVQRDLSEMYEQALAAGITPVAATVLPYNTATPKARMVLRGLNAWVAATASTLRIPWCDTNAAVRDPADPERLAGSPDDLHPDVAGYRRIGEAFVRTLEVHLQYPRV